MVKIISLLIHFLNTISKLLYRLECFLLRFLLNDSSSSPSSDAYRRFKVKPLPILESDFIPISFQQAKNDYEAKQHKPLKPISRHKGRDYPSKRYVCPHCGAMNISLSIMMRRNLKSELKKLSKEDKKKYKVNPSQFSLHYITHS